MDLTSGPSSRCGYLRRDFSTRIKLVPVPGPQESCADRETTRRISQELDRSTPQESQVLQFGKLDWSTRLADRADHEHLVRRFRNRSEEHLGKSVRRPCNQRQMARA